MNLRPRPVPRRFDELNLMLSKYTEERRAILEKLIPVDKPTENIWEMRLPDTVYTAPVGAFWFVSTGRGR